MFNQPLNLGYFGWRSPFGSEKNVQPLNPEKSQYNSMLRKVRTARFQLFDHWI
jgi:hypothetical protein